MVHFVNMRPELGAKYFIDPILASLQAFYLDPESNLPPDSVLVADTRISTAVESIERLIAGSEPSPTLMRIISKVVPQLYFLWEKAEASKLVMRSALRQILEAFFKLADVSDAVAALYDVALKTEIVRSEAGGLSFVVPAKPLLERIRAGENQVVDLEAFCAFVAGLEQPSIVGELFLAVLEEALCEAAEMQHAAAILAMMNEFGDALLKDTRQVLQFVKSMLIDSEHEGIALALTLLKEIFSAASLDLDDDAQRVIADIRIILQTLTQHPDEDIRAASREIRAAMAARLAPANVGPSSSQDTLSSTAQDAAAMAAEKKARDQFREALKNLGDELLPVRAFGMSVLRQLVLDRSAVARENLESIISIFLDLVEDEDSFIYLNAVKGLSALTDVYAPQTLSRIAKRYMDKESLTLDYRVRIGEALMQTIHRSGQVFPKHGK
ncbi:hypothetical protein HK105_202784 [Polyrhizophydium stewartii]|uniref:RNA polymerase II assembly factor Rtp1 C-terminal domain-containing protein n=1 Tax=Polyrhizophydium stewartii TaxID=2732419 RepID=A0ABR4NDA0_9FUNG